MKKIMIEIKDGKIKVETSGFRGRDCITELKKISKDTGLEAQNIKMTSESYQSVKQKRRVKIE